MSTKDLPPNHGDFQSHLSIDTKYRTATDPNTAEQHWYAIEDSNLPLRYKGPPPTQAQLERAVTRQDFKCQLLDCADPAQLTEYNRIMDRVAQGEYVLRKCIERWPADKSHPSFWLEWLERYHVIPSRQF